MKLPPPLTLEDAQARLIALAPLMPVETLPVDDAIGRYLATPLAARRTQPPADLSAMDGYAVRSNDVAGPWSVIGESAAGHPFAGLLSPGEAVRISTGALMPADAACVILQEDIVREGAVIAISGERPDPPAKHVRPAGLDFRAGDMVLEAGVRIGPAQAALALSAGHATLEVRQPVRVAVIDSGDELAVAPDSCEPHQIPASNGAMLAAMVRETGCEVRRIGPVPDRLEALQAAFDSAGDCDVVITSGGASVGDHDLVRPALEARGSRIDFWRVAIKPGKPFLVATRERGGSPQLVIGLPGNPVSSFVTCFLFALPTLRTAMGAAHPLPRAMSARIGAPLRAIGSRREFVRAHWDGESVTPQEVLDSGALASLAGSNVLIDRPANAPAATTGEKVRLYWIGIGGIA
ncbi:MAG: molybdopterin molybdotransferase MoeA [Alphaproteobacteria bacterium]|nr:molybdopterin molybdotransferase MoeA [Alphaproteobacteria bacterium]